MQEAERRARPRRWAGPGQDPAWAQPWRGFRDVRRRLLSQRGTGRDEATDPCWVKCEARHQRAKVTLPPTEAVRAPGLAL